MRVDEVRPRWQRRIVVGAAGVVAVVALGLGMVLPLALCFADATRTPYPIPAHHAVFVHTVSSATECLVVEAGIDTERIRIDRAEPIPFTGYRLAPRAFDGATVRCTGKVTVVVDPDWRYDLANNQPAKVALSLLGLAALAGIKLVTRRREPDLATLLITRAK